MKAIHISLTNAKLGGKIPSINLPAGKTCRADAPCQKGCYAKKGTFIYPNAKESLANNLLNYIMEPENYFQQIINYLNDNDICFRFFRWHASGDIVDYNYLLGIIEVAKAVPQTRFLCFTKKFNLVNKYLDKGFKIPQNLNIVFSAWDNVFKVENPYNLPVTYVSFNNPERNADIPQNAFKCTGDCSTCKICWNLASGQSTVFHQH